ncbi:putative endopeptidase precursor [Corynebacterium capitovis DSM 44611]|uniref:C40 family peptidase n=1 Tax=Corynebacterium capitovis TaxID=131081 RepID=UPI000378E3B6|nr:C40 family peptidase [Corynebacterium capitovis]WKD57343.1 putative endopeptidase precursor [Corynebacterium capitovis DSM 44611]
MGKHSLPSRHLPARVALGALSLSVAGAASAIAVVGVEAGTGLSATANADDIQTLIDDLSSVSHDATAKSEELKATEDAIAQAEAALPALYARVDQTRAEAQAAAGARKAGQLSLNGVAASQNRTSASDTLVNNLGASNPQELIDRAAYLGSISRSNERALQDLRQLTADAAERATEANIAVVEAEYQRNQLDAKRLKLERERADLDAKVKEVEARVNALSPADRVLWEAKDNPILAPLADLNSAASGVVSAAMAQLGKPYGWGAAGPDAFDCSGLMAWSYAQNGKSIPRTSQAQLAGGTPVSLSELQPGDIVGYYPGVTHVGMYIGNGQVVHASDYGIPVQVVPLNSMPIQGAVRY